MVHLVFTYVCLHILKLSNSTLTICTLTWVCGGFKTPKEGRAHSTKLVKENVAAALFIIITVIARL